MPVNKSRNAGFSLVELMVAMVISLIVIGAVIALVSFVACVVIQPLKFKAVFFLSPFRAWELLLGSLLGIGAIPQIRSHMARNVVAILALAILLGAVASMEEGIDFPGWKAIIPVVATAMLPLRMVRRRSASRRMVPRVDDPLRTTPR